MTPTMLARSNGGATVKAGYDTWFIVAADFAFGKVLNDEATAVVEAAGGKVLGTAFYLSPGTTDFSSLLLRAKASGAKVLAFANAATETVNCVKQAQEFGLTSSMKIAALLMYVTDVHALGLEAAQGLMLTETFYWDLNERTRAFTDRVRPRTPGNLLNMGQDGCVLHPAYLFRVKKPAESKSEWDLLSLVATMPGEQAFRPLEAGNCPLVRL